MKIKSSKVILAIFLSALLLVSCSNSKYNSGKKVDNIMDLIDGDNSDLRGCFLLIKISKWKKSEYIESYRDGWSRDISLRYNDGITQLETGETIYDKNDYLNSIKIKNNPKYALIHVGKWHHVKKLNQDIRLIAYQFLKEKGKYGTVRYNFESKNKENKKIKEMPFTPIKPVGNSSGGEVCMIKWYSKYGYNAVAETKRAWYPGFWGKLLLQRQLIITGKVIQAEE